MATDTLTDFAPGRQHASPISQQAAFFTQQSRVGEAVLLPIFLACGHDE